MGWNHYQHLEAYFGVPAIGAVLHTLNFRLHPDDIVYIANHGGDRIILVDEILLPMFVQVRPRLNAERVIVMQHGNSVPEGMLAYEELIADSDPADFIEPDIDERQAATMCYTSGTTGKPKGVIYSHRALALHSLSIPGSELVIREPDTLLPVVPMFHANGWGVPYFCPLVGAKLVLPGPFLDVPSLVRLMEIERVTWACGVPTIWLEMLRYLDSHPGEFDLSALKGTTVGGQMIPPATIRAFRDRYDIGVLQGWGMTETGPVASVASVPSELIDASSEVHAEYAAKQGRPQPFTEIRLRLDDGTLGPHDGETMGELEIRGAWVASSYYNDPDSRAKFTDDGWLRTGDIVTIDSLSYIVIRDRAKDLIKSGGEWISSVALENELMAHPAVAEAAIIAAAHPRWLERPVAVVVFKDGATETEEELRQFLAPSFAKWWLPDAVVFVDEIPRTSTGKFMKAALRERYSQILTDPTAKPTAVADD